MNGTVSEYLPSRFRREARRNRSSCNGVGVIEGTVGKGSAIGWNCNCAHVVCSVFDASSCVCVASFACGPSRPAHWKCMRGAPALLAYCPLIVLLLPSCSPLILLSFRPSSRRGLWGPVPPCHRAFGWRRYSFDGAMVVPIHRNFNFPKRVPDLECRRGPRVRRTRTAYAKARNHDLA
jgi:hypothetical protein